MLVTLTAGYAIDSERELRELDASYATFRDLLDRVRVDALQTKLSIACASLRAAVVACMTQPRLWHVLRNMSVLGQRNGQEQAVRLARNAVGTVNGHASESFKVTTLVRHHSKASLSQSVAVWN